MQLFYEPELIGLQPGDQFVLNATESHHLQHVLRLRVGSSLAITNGQGWNYEALLLENGKSGCKITIQQGSFAAKPTYQVHLAVSPTRNADRFEWLVEKAIEIGLDSLTPLLCERTTKHQLKSDRLQRLAISAMKQSLKSWLPVIHPPTKLEHYIQGVGMDQRFVAFVDFTNPDQLFNLVEANRSYCLLIGPEGDFTDAELEFIRKHQFKKVSLGPSRLRTETAALAGVMALNLRNQL